MVLFKKLLKEATNVKKISAKDFKIFTKFVYSKMPKKGSSNYTIWWDSPQEFYNTFTKVIDQFNEEKNKKYELDADSWSQFTGRLKNYRSDTYLKVDEASSTLLIKDQDAETQGYMQISAYNDPAKGDPSTTYEINYYFN